VLLPSLTPSGPSAGPVLLVAVRGGDVALSEVPSWSGDDDGIFVGSVAGRHCWAIDLNDGGAAETWSGPFVNLMRLHGDVDEIVWAAAGRAVQLVDWNRNHRFCGRCATPTEISAGERARRCASCGLQVFPRLAPAIITLVERDDGRVLLARNARWPGGMYSCLAGFVEPGESVEDAVRREVREEVGVDVDGLRYFGSQPWPFPHSLMLGFHARYAGGDLVVDGEEIAEARWFGADELPAIPGRISIARKLIDDWRGRSGPRIADEESGIGS